MEKIPLPNSICSSTLVLSQVHVKVARTARVAMYGCVEGRDLDPRFVTNLLKGSDGEAPACQPPTNPPSPHDATVDAAEC